MTTFNDAKVEFFFETAKYFQKNLINLFCSGTSPLLDTNSIKQTHMQKKDSKNTLIY